MNLAVPDSVLMSKISPRARLLWIYLSAVKDASITQIAEDIGLDRRNVIRHIRALEEREMLVVYRARGFPNLYEVRNP